MKQGVSLLSIARTGVGKCPAEAVITTTKRFQHKQKKAELDKEFLLFEVPVQFLL